MSLVKEALRGDVGKVIRLRLNVLIGQLDEVTLQGLRSGLKPHDEVRYMAGYADGMRCALNTIADLATDQEE